MGDFFLQQPAALRGQLVIAPLRFLSIDRVMVRSGFPHQPRFNQAVDRRVERAGPKPDGALALCFRLLLDRIAMGGAVGQREQDVQNRGRQRTADFCSHTVDMSLDDMSAVLVRCDDSGRWASEASRPTHGWFCTGFFEHSGVDDAGQGRRQCFRSQPPTAKYNKPARTVRELPEITTLQQLLDRLDQAATGERVDVDCMMNAVGRSSFGALLLLGGLVTLSPLDIVPGIPTLIALAVFTVCVQLLANRHHFWLPGWVLRRSISCQRFRRALTWLKKPARFGDRLVRPRLTFLATGAAAKVIAVGCIVVAVAMPIMEVVPFSANLAGLALTAFGLAVIAHDGLLALVAFGATVAGVVVIASQLL